MPVIAVFCLACHHVGGKHLLKKRGVLQGFKDGSDNHTVFHVEFIAESVPVSFAR